MTTKAPARVVLGTNVVLSALLFGGGPAVRIPDPPPAVPPCRDPFDLPFLQLAIAGRARALVSGDRDLLALAGTPGLCPVLGIEAFCAQFLGD